MISFVPLTQLNGFSHEKADTSKTHAKHDCMFCHVDLRSEKALERHLEQLHPGWAMLLLQKIGMHVARENG